MRAKNLLGEKMNKLHSQAIPGMSELKTDQYYGTYKWSKDVAGHDGKTQTAPKADPSPFKDAPVTGGISKTEREMAKKAAGGKVKGITSDGSKEHKDTQTKSPISGNKLKEARMSAAVKLQRAWERQQAKSAASRKRGEELLNPPKKEEPKKTTEGILDNPGQPDSPVANALIRRILLQRTDLLAKYGPEKVGQAIDDVADWVGDVDEIGSSDVSGWVKDVERSLSESLGEAEEDAFVSALKGLKTWQVVIFNNYYAGKYTDYRGRYYYVLASSEDEARQVVLSNADGILHDILSMKSHNGKKILPRSTAVPITDKRIGKIEDGTVAGRMSTAGYKKMFGPEGVMMVKLSAGEVVDVQEQGVEEARTPSNLVWDGERIKKDPAVVAANKRKKAYQAYLRRKAAKEKEVEEPKVDESAEDRRQKRLWAMITDYEKRAAKTNNDIKRDHYTNMANDLRSKLKTSVAEGAGGIGQQIKALYKKIHNQGDDAVEFMYYDSPIFAQYWDEYEGDLDSIIAEVDPSELQIIYDELLSAAENEGIEEGAFDNASPMAKDSIKQDKIRSLKNLIAVAKEQGRRLRVQELELELKKLQTVDEVSDKLRNRYVARASDDYGSANFAARASKSHPGLEDYSKEQERRAEKRRAGLNRALSDKRRGVEEMDSQGYTGSRDHKSMSTYGNRDRDDKITGPDVHLGPEHMIKSKDLVSHLHKALDRALSKEKKASPAQVQRNKERWAKRQQGLSEGKVAEADAILRQIAEDEDWDLLYKIHGMAGQPTPEGMAGNMIDDMYQDAAIESGHHADDDFEEIYNIVLDRIIEEYGIEESVQVNEVDPRNFDSDIDYYDALRRPSRRSSDNFDEPEKEDPWAEFDRAEAQRKAKAAKSAPTVEYSKEEGQAPNGKRYNMSVKFTSPDKHRADFAADNWMDSEWGAKKLVDKEQHEHNGETTVTIYVQDNHKHGYWKPWKDEEPISKGISFESTNEDVGYKFNTSPKAMPRNTLGTDMSYHWGHGGGNKYGIDSRLGPREDPRFGKRGDGKQGYRPEYQKPSEYSDAKDTATTAHPNELHKLLAKHGQLNSKLKRLEKSNVASANDLAIKRIQQEIESIEHSINDLGGSDFLRHYTESQQQAMDLNKLEESFVTKFADKYKGK